SVGTGNALILADLDRDGRLDVVLGSGGNGAPNALTMYRGDGDGTFRQPAAWQQSVPDQVFGLTSGDINRAGWVDLVSVDLFDTHVFFGTGGGNIAFHEEFRAADSPFKSALGDFDGTGGMDLALVGFGDFCVHMLLSDNDGTFV